MKKSFMTRALAMGLSVAMAFSLSAATNVSVASAAATPAMASKQFAVRVGGAAKSYKASTATQKSFKITKATVGNTDKATVSINSSKKSIKVTPGTVTGTTVVKVTFKNNKTKKSTTKSYRCVVKGEVKQDPAITSAKQTGVKTLTVTTNFDAEAAQSKVSVKRGTNDVATDKVAFSEDGKTITILTTANIVAADYTVYVGDLSQAVKGETSKVAKIEILGDKAAAEKVNGKYQRASVGYRVTNQFEDDITKTTSLTVNSSANREYLSSKDHLIVFEANNEFMINRDIITVTLLDQTGVSATANLTVSMEAYAKDMTFEGIYNSEKKTLTEDSDTAADTFYLLFSAVDQYGNKFMKYKDVYEGEHLFLSVIGGLTTLGKGYDTKMPFTVITKDGTDYLAYPVTFKDSSMWPVAGEVSIQLLSTGGSSCTGTVTVAEGNRVTAITVNSPGVIASGEKTALDFTATDAAGNDVKAYKILRHVEPSYNASYPVSWVKNTDGTAKLVLDATVSAPLTEKQTSMQTYTFKTQGQKFYHTQLTITEKARPVAIDGVKDLDTTISKDSNYVSIKLKNLKIEDQYGRIMSNEALKNAVQDQTALDTTNAQYKLSQVDIELPAYSKLKFFGTSDPIDDTKVTTKSAIFNKDSNADTEICRLVPIAGVKGDTIVEFQIHNGYTDTKEKGLNDATADVLFTVKDTTNVEAATVSVGEIYVVKDDADTYAEKYAQDVIVKANGAVLPKTDYSVSVPSDMAVGDNDSGSVNVHKIWFKNLQKNVGEFNNNAATTATRKIKVTLNGTGETITQDITLSSVAPYVKTVDLKSDTYAVNSNDIDNATSTYCINNYYVYDACISGLKDQYGKDLTKDTTWGLKFANGDDCKPNVTFTFNTYDYKKEGSLKTHVVENGEKDDKAKLYLGTSFKAATMAIAFNGNIEDKQTAEINITRGTTNSTSKPEDKFNTIQSCTTDKEAASIIDGSLILQTGTDWSNLDTADKDKVGKALRRHFVKATTTSAAIAQIAKYSTPAALTRKSIKNFTASMTAIENMAAVTSGTAFTVVPGGASSVAVECPDSTSGSGIVITGASIVKFDESVIARATTGASIKAQFYVDYTYTTLPELNTKVYYDVTATNMGNGVIKFAVTKKEEV